MSFDIQKQNLQEKAKTSNTAWVHVSATHTTFGQTDNHRHTFNMHISSSHGDCPAGLLGPLIVTFNIMHDWVICSRQDKLVQCATNKGEMLVVSCYLPNVSVIKIPFGGSSTFRLTCFPLRPSTGRPAGCTERQQLRRCHQQSAAGGKRASPGTRHGGWAARPCRCTNYRQL